MEYQNIIDIVKTGINICVYYDSMSEKMINEIACENPNVKMMNSFSMEDLISLTATTSCFIILQVLELCPTHLQFLQGIFVYILVSLVF